MLSFVGHLRTLVLIDCNNLPFILALDPEQNPSNLVSCFNMEGLVLYIQDWSLLHFECLIRMANNRALRGAKLSSITIYLDGGGPTEEVFKLREYVTHVVFKVGVGECNPPVWDDIPGESGGGNE